MPQTTLDSNDAALTFKARNVARLLTYNDRRAEAEAKFLLLELAERLDARNTRIGYQGAHVVNAKNQFRPLTFREWFLNVCFGVVPPKV